MPLTVVVGSSGSGKTTFLNDVRKMHKCTYIRQYHNLRPYIMVRKIPSFDPTQLPYWSLYKDNPNIRIGGTMAGEFTAGLSGGQRKMLLFELVKQRTESEKGLCILLDEPYAGVTDDFVPWIVKELTMMKKAHNILLVTNDHVETLTDLADNTIIVSALDRTTVQINEKKKVDRELALAAVSSGKHHEHTGNLGAAISFFLDVEILGNAPLKGVLSFTVVAMGLFLLSYWNSKTGSDALVMVAIQLIGFFCLNPYLLALTDWRNFMTEEAEALMHASVMVNKAFKTCLVLFLLMSITAISYLLLQAVIDDLSGLNIFISMLADSASMTLPLICLGLYTTLPLTLVQIVGTIPFLFMIFFSTTFSPGSGVEGLSALRFLFARFYLWCQLPSVQLAMEGCPDRSTMWAVISGSIGFVLFAVILGIQRVVQARNTKQLDAKRKGLLNDKNFTALQQEMFPTEARSAVADKELVLTENVAIAVMSD